MKNGMFVIALLLLISSVMYGQNTVRRNVEENTTESLSEEASNIVVSAGLMMGGGSLIGLDLEYIIPKTRLGIQIGAGISSFGGGINYHLKDGINSSFLTVQYLHQGFGDNHYASWLGPMFVFRARKRYFHRP